MVETYVYGRETYPLEKILKQIDYFSVMYDKAKYPNHVYNDFKCSKLSDGWYIEGSKGERGLTDAQILERLKKFCDKVIENHKSLPPIILFNAPKDFDKEVLTMRKLSGFKTVVHSKKSSCPNLASELSKNFRKML